MLNIRFIVSVILSAIAITTPAWAQVVNGLRIDNTGLSPFFVESGGTVSIHFDAINGGSSFVRVNGFDVSVNNAPYQFTSMPFDLPPEGVHRVFFTITAPTVGCITMAAGYSVAFRLNYNDNRTGPGASVGGLISVPTHISISTQPMSRTVCINGNANFTVVSSGTQPRFEWQWRRPGSGGWTVVVNGYNTDGVNGPRLFYVEDATTPTLRTYSPPDVVPLPVMELRVVISNMCGMVTSNIVTLTRNGPPSLSLQPMSAQTCDNQTASFVIAAMGSGTLSYSWQLEVSPDNWLALSPTPVSLPGGGTATATPANSPTVQISVQGRSGSFGIRCVVSNSCGSVISIAATLTVDVDPTIEQQPAPASVCLSGSATFSVVAAGPGPLSYQWRRNGVLIDAGTNPSAADAMLMLFSITAADAAAYDCIVSNGCGAAVSDAATLTVQVCCSADFNRDGVVNSADFFDFLTGFFVGEADFNHDGQTTSQDFFDFLTAFFKGC